MKLSSSLRHGLLSFDEFDEIFVQDYSYNKVEECWSIYMCTTMEETNNLPSSLFWYCNISKDYPKGRIDIYPCKKRGLTTTFHHQNINKQLSDKPWTNGKLCLDSAFDLNGVQISKKEPKESKLRLKWHLERFIDWLQRADKGALIEDGDPYELPDFDTYIKRSWGFVGKLEELEVFDEYLNDYGYFHYFPTEGLRFNLIHKFSDKHGVDIFSLPTDSSTKGFERIGLWILLEREIVFKDWQVPQTYKELRVALEDNGINFDSVLSEIFKKRKKKNAIRAISIGFPIPKTVGTEPVSIHWQILEIPELLGKPKGFRPYSSSVLSYNKQRFFSDGQRVNWYRSVNINPEYLFSRVPNFKDISEKRICIIGLGSLGSLFTEALVRSGLTSLHVIDFDLFREGNLCRHILTIDSLDYLKVDKVAERLRKINPFVQITSECKAVDDKYNFDSLKNFDVVIDLTASDEVLGALENNKAELNDSMFFSFSFGLMANPIFCYTSKLNEVSCDYLDSLIKDYQEEVGEDNKLSNEGIGCWSPVFPSSVFSVQNASHTCFEYFIAQLKNTDAPNVTIYAKVYEDRNYAGTKKIN